MGRRGVGYLHAGGNYKATSATLTTDQPMTSSEIILKTKNRINKTAETSVLASGVYGRKRPMKKGKASLFRQIAVLCLLSLVCGTAGNLISPRRITWAEDWDQYIATQAREAGIAVASIAEARELMDAGAILIDARSRKDFDAGHIPNAFSLPFENRQNIYSEFREWLFPDLPLLLYCSGGTCDEGILLAKHLNAMGHTNITLFAQGFEGWKKTRKERDTQ